MSDTITVTTALKAETLLGDSHILTQIENLRTSLRYKTDGNFISFDDMFLSLEKQIDALPKLKLAPAVANGTENQYIVQLISSLEQVLDDTDRVGQKVIHYEAKLRDAAVQVKSVGTAFGVWYTLAAAELLTMKYGGMIIPLGQLKELAKTEFNRLMENSETQVNSLISAVKATNDRLKLHKKTQQDKFNLGKDQANASWTSKFPAFGNTMSESDSTQLVDRSDEAEEVVEEEVDESPAFVMTTPKVGTSATWKDHKGDTVMAAVVNLEGDKPEPKFRVHGETDPKFATVYELAPNGGVQTTDGVPVVRGDENGFPKLVISNAPVSIQTFTGTPGPSTTVAVVPDAQFDQLKAAVQDGPVDAKRFASLLSDEPVKVKTAKAPKDPNAKAKSTTALTFVWPDINITLDRVKDGQPEKIKCVVCDRRIRIGQKMFERDGGYAHAVSTDCTDAPVKTAAPVDAPPATKPLEAVVPVLSTSVPVLSTVEPDSIVEQMVKEHPVLLTPNPTLAVKVAMNQPVSTDELNSLIEKARLIVPTEAEKEEQRRGFAAANLALDNGRPVGDVRKDVDAAADAMAAAATATPVINIPPRKRIPFLEDDGAVI